MAVTDVEMEDADARVQQVLDLLAEMREIRRVQRRLDLDCPHPVAPSHNPILDAEARDEEPTRPVDVRQGLEELGTACVPELRPPLDRLDVQP